MTSPFRTSGLAAVLTALAVMVGACANPATPSPSSPLPGSSAATLVVSPEPSPSPSPSPSIGFASSSPDASPSESPLPSDSASPSVSPSPTATPQPATPPPATGRPLATRVVIPRLGIDLRVVKSPHKGVFPYCNVAMYISSLGQPGEHRATYLFAHARDGMFGPIWQLTIVKRTPNKMVGMLVDVYTSDSKVHTYRIVKVLPHRRSLDTAIAVRTDQLWLQTSEGPNSTYPKTQVVANPISVAPAGYAASHPKTRLVRCA